MEASDCVFLSFCNMSVCMLPWSCLHDNGLNLWNASQPQLNAAIIRVDGVMVSVHSNKRLTKTSRYRDVSWGFSVVQFFITHVVNGQNMTLPRYPVSDQNMTLPRYRVSDQKMALLGYPNSSCCCSCVPAVPLWTDVVSSGDCLLSMSTSTQWHVCCFLLLHCFTW